MPSIILKLEFEYNKHILSNYLPYFIFTLKKQTNQNIVSQIHQKTSIQHDFDFPRLHQKT